MIIPASNLTFVNRRTDLLVEVSDAFAVPALGFTAIQLGMVEYYHIRLAPRGGTTVALEAM